MKHAVRVLPGVVLLWIACSLLTGCLILPFPVDDAVPYIDDIPHLEVGSSTKRDVIEQLGEPAANYSHGSIYVYSDFEKTWEVAYFLAAPYAGGDAGVQDFGNRHYLVLYFDELGVLADHKVEIGDGRGDCTETGFCTTVYGHVVWLAGEEEEDRAKEFPVSNEGCGLYLYLHNWVGPRQASVALDSESLGHVGDAGSVFFFEELSQGKHEIVAHQPTAEPESVELPVVCKENEHIFVRMTIRHSLKNTPELDLVDASTGMKKVKARRLIIPYSSH
jgi:hypothetical protein